MKDIKQELNRFLEDFKSSVEVEKIRNAISLSISQEGLIDLENIKRVEEILNKWFVVKLYSLGRTIKELETIANKFDFDTAIGIGYSVEAKKDKINIGRYLLHLLLIIESKDRQIANLIKEVQAEKQNYIEMENIISELINNEKTFEEIREECNKFYYLQKNI